MRDVNRGLAFAGLAAARARPRVPRIGKSGPPVPQVMAPPVPHAQLVSYSAINAEPDDWFRIMQNADSGDTGPMMDLFSDARDRDSHLDGVVRKRVQQMMGRPFVFHPPVGYERDKEAIDACTFVSRALLEESRGFRSQLCGLMAGAVYGYAVSKIRWRTNGAAERIPHLEWEHPNRFGWDRETRKLGFYSGPYRSHYSIKPLSDYPDCFVAHVPMGGRSDYPWRRGPMRSCIIPSFIKRQGLRFWLVAAEKYGQPKPYAIVPPGIDDDGQSNASTIAVVQESLNKLNSTHWAATFTKGIEIGNIEGAGTVTGEVQKGLIDWAEMTMSIAILGQNLSTKVEGGSFAAAEAHRFVAGDLHLADAVELAETISQQIVEPLIRYNRPGAPLPVCEITTGAKQVFDHRDVELGIASADERRRTLGHDAIPDGKGAEYRRVTVDVLAAIGAPVTATPEALGIAEPIAPANGASVVPFAA